MLSRQERNNGVMENEDVSDPKLLRGYCQVVQEEPKKTQESKQIYKGKGILCGCHSVRQIGDAVFGECFGTPARHQLFLVIQAHFILTGLIILVLQLENPMPRQRKEHGGTTIINCSWKEEIFFLVQIQPSKFLPLYLLKLPPLKF